MSRSVLLQLARDSIAEVFQAQNTINKDLLKIEHPLLRENIAATIQLHLDTKVRGVHRSDASKSLLENIIISAKKAAFENREYSPITTSEYLFCEVEIILTTRDGVMSEKDPAILKEE